MKIAKKFKWHYDEYLRGHHFNSSKQKHNKHSSNIFRLQAYLSLSILHTLNLVHIVYNSQLWTHLYVSLNNLTWFAFI